MIDKVMDAFEAWQAAKDDLDRAETSHDIRTATHAVARTRDQVCRAMDEWYEWKRLNGPQNPGR